MQRTRLNTLVDLAARRIEQFFGNPWRRISVILISLLLGFFLGSAIPTTAGQTASWDIVMAAFLILFTELINRWFYSSNLGRQDRNRNQRSLLVEMLNFMKIGVTYGLFLEAFKLGS